MARIGVCDDSREMSLKIAGLVEKSFGERGYGCTVESFSDGTKLLEQNALAPFDILFLDIDMPGVSGFDIAKELQSELSQCLIIFVTSHAELVYDSFDFRPFNFLRKNSEIPLEESIPRVVEKLAFYIRQEETVVLEDKTRGSITVKIRDIISIESSGHYLIYSIFRGASPEKIMTRGVISEREEFYKNYSFARAHKGFLVNLARTEYLSSGRREAGLSCGITVPIGRKYLSSLEEKYSMYLRRRS